MPAELYLIRHAEPFFPDGVPVYLGREQDYPLSQEGRRHAEETAESLKKAGITRVYASPAKRCRETAEPLSKALGLEINILDDLRELDSGEWAGRSVTEIRSQYGEAFKNGTCFPPPGGERDEEGLIRAMRALEVIRNSACQSAAVISHRGMLGLMLCAMTGTPLKKRNVFDIRCAVPIRVSVTEEGRYLAEAKCFRTPENNK